MPHPVNIRLLNQQLVAPLFTSPTDVVKHMGAMQAQEYRMMRWAVGMRTKNPSLSTFRKAYDSGEIVRLHLLRCTWQLIASDDYHWLFPLCAPKALTTLRGWMHGNGIDIEEKEHRPVGELLAQIANDMGSATKEDFADALASRGMQMTMQELSYHIRLAELYGTLCSGHLLPMKASYSAVATKIKPSTHFDRDEALMLLARRYFQSHSPATLDDFVWWSGLNKGDCQRAIALLGNELHTYNYNKRAMYIHAMCRTRGCQKGKALLIAPYDEYLIGYKSRDLSLPAEYRHRAHNNSGIFYPIIATDGIISGNWSPFANDLQLDFFTDADHTPFLSAWKKYQKFLTK